VTAGKLVRSGDRISVTGSTSGAKPPRSLIGLVRRRGSSGMSILLPVIDRVAVVDRPTVVADVGGETFVSS
jgi:hypothetical protein